MNEIVTDIFTWAWFSEPHGYNFNGHLVRHGERNLCIDPVQPSEEGIADIARIGAAKILLTNRNHSRAAHVIRARTGARTLIHPDDAAHARSQGAEIDGDLNVDEKIGPLTIVAVPGKSPGEVALHWPDASPERKQNFTRVCTISGVGPVVGTALVNTLERVPVRSADAFVAFTGLLGLSITIPNRERAKPRSMDRRKLSPTFNVNSSYQTRRFRV
jgi:hypothetical protein